MGTLSSCPGCGRRAKQSMHSNHFVVSTCVDCRHKYCSQCGGKQCPRCGSTKRNDFDKVVS